MRFSDNYIRCLFNKDNSNNHTTAGRLNIYYADSNELENSCIELKAFISKDEMTRAAKFHFEEDRKTYILCHAMLRLILALKLNKSPRNISIVKNENGKPEIDGDLIFFNITHTRFAFAIAISGEHSVGIDMEKIDLNLEFKQIIKSFFSKSEREYILKSAIDSRERFFLLWTRKEALLKAIGTGIVPHLDQIEVSGDDNNLKREIFDTHHYIPDTYYIYSNKIQEHYISIATSGKAKIEFTQINNEYINLIVSKST